MMLVAIWPLIILIAGALLWVLATNPIVKDMGRIAFAVGLLVTCLVVSKQVVKIGAAEAVQLHRSA
jgi:Na+/phosphate symporter